MTVLVTGASGLAGNATCAQLVATGMNVVGTVRHLPTQPLAGVDYRIVDDLSGRTDWRDVFKGIDTVVHCAARVHVMQETAPDPLAIFRAVNVAGTEQLARQAATAGVRRFVSMSSVKVNITKVCEVLGWTPPLSVDEGLRRTASHYLQQQL
jgi:UDP-glucose 4-epimerase